MQNPDAKENSFLLVLKLIWFSQLASCAMFAFIIYSGLVPPSTENQNLGTIFSALGLAAVFLAPLIRRVFLSIGGGDQWSGSQVSKQEKLQKYFLPVLLSMVIAESGAVMGLLSYIMGGSSETALLLCLAAAVSIFICSPKPLEVA